MDARTQQMVNRVISYFGGPNRLRKGETKITKDVKLCLSDQDATFIREVETGVCEEAGWKFASITPGHPAATVTLGI